MTSPAETPAENAAETGEPLTIDDLARRVQLPVRTIREYHTMRLLPPPERQGRLGLYHDRHVQRHSGQALEPLRTELQLKRRVVLNWRRRDQALMVGVEIEIVFRRSHSPDVTTNSMRNSPRLERSIVGTAALGYPVERSSTVLTSFRNRGLFYFGYQSSNRTSIPVPSKAFLNTLRSEPL